MGERAAPAISALIELLDDHGLETVKEDGRMFMTFGVTAGAAANALASIGKPAIQPLRVALKEPGAAKERVYWRAKALARMNQPAATETLLATLKQPTFPYRDQVAWALGDCTDARALPALLLLAKDEDPKMRRGAVKGLDGNKDPKAVDALVEALADTDKEVRGSAATGLYSAADPRTFDVLVSALKDPDDFVRNLSAQALGAIGDRRAIGPLVVLVANDPENLVRFQAGRALEAITGEHFGENGAQWQTWWEKQKPVYALQLEILEPATLAGRTIAGKLYATVKALWKLSWFLRDFGYDAELLGNDEIDDKSQVNTRRLERNTVTRSRRQNGHEKPHLEAAQRRGPECEVAEGPQ